MITKDHIKGALIAEFKKEGKSLAEVEESLQKQAGVSESLNNIKGLAQAFLGTAAGAGVLGGLGLYGMYGLSEHSDDKIREAMEVKRRLQQAKQELETIKLQQQAGPTI